MPRYFFFQTPFHSLYEHADIYPLIAPLNPLVVHWEYCSFAGCYSGFFILKPGINIKQIRETLHMFFLFGNCRKFLQQRYANRKLDSMNSYPPGATFSV